MQQRKFSPQRAAKTGSIFLSTAAAYDRWSAGYDGYDNPMVQGATRIVELLGHKMAGASVFEFGCGTGRNLRALKRLGAASVAGCDLSEGMLAEARRADASLRLFRHDMTRPLPADNATPGAFDRVLFCLTLEHLADMTPPLREAARLLRPTGRIDIIEIHPDVAAGGVAAHFVDNGETVRMPVFAHGLGEYEAAFKAVGLCVTLRRQWRPVDFGEAATPKMFKRGGEFPLLVQYQAMLERKE
ncbi:MAG: hypothetical protein AUJ49_00760 [Desulfovibrionaceae bacterium CG1_02_65_16]|nr:MAG: hypothetical protein AUJ49_00760 [Desulfovibrionaceae bacterium CG1_02_65_16]